MNPIKFVDTIYLGDRSCKAILIDGWNNFLKIQIDMISRIRSENGIWDFYNDENIKDGYIVFKDLKSIHFEPQGFIPNGEIDFISAKAISDIDNEGNGEFLFQLFVLAYDKSGNCEKVIVKIIARDICLENPANPGVEITD
ncbi:DUF6258 family protein [Clostridium thailandense]|uniref:DUF6258 family protein n=1 Tax=Clostridium thailandense TaxID=2794346 RepID=UPI003989A461